MLKGTNKEPYGTPVSLSPQIIPRIVEISFVAMDGFYSFYFLKSVNIDSSTFSHFSASPSHIRTDGGFLDYLDLFLKIISQM
jgi:hypothetical protein